MALTAVEVRDMEARLAEHYGEPVRPVSAYCQGFADYRKALSEALGRGDFHEDHPDREVFQRAVEALGALDPLPIRKSNLLYRLVYLGEPLRTDKCPEHQGHWQGYNFDGPVCACQSGLDITGWLPPPSPSGEAQERVA